MRCWSAWNAPIGRSKACARLRVLERASRAARLMRPRSMALAPTAAEPVDAARGASAAPTRCRGVVERHLAEALREVDRLERASPRTGASARHDALRRRDQQRVGVGGEGHEVLRARARVPLAKRVPRPGRPLKGASSRAMVTSCRPATQRRARSASCPPAAARSAAASVDVEERTGQRRPGPSPRSTIASSIGPSPWPPARGRDAEAEVAHLGERAATPSDRSRAASCSMTRRVLLERQLLRRGSRACERGGAPDRRRARTSSAVLRKARARASR